MKPLSSITFIRNNIKKALPSFICTMISVFLVYFFGVLLYGSVDSFNKASVNVVQNATMVYSNNADKPINSKIVNEIKSDNNVKYIVPSIGTTNSFNYQAVCGNAGGIETFIIYSQDADKALKGLKIKLVSGRIPKDNAHEIILPDEFMKQYKLKLGQNINNYTNINIHLDKSYKIVGVTEGNAFTPMTCDVGKIKRSDAEKFGLIFFFKDSNNKKLNDKITKLNDKNIVTMEYKALKDNMDQMVSSMDVLYVALNVIILLVLCISLGNLNYIVFINRKNEFSVLNAIGVSKARLRRKLFYENTIICTAGYIIGIGFTLLVTWLLNTAVWHSNGQNIPVIRPSSMLVALVIPCAVSLMSLISSLKEFKMLSYENLNV